MRSDERRGAVGGGGDVRPVRIHVVTIALLILAAVVDTLWSPVSTRSMTVVDPEGVTVVVNRAPAWGQGARWSVDPMPALQVGVVDGDAAYQFQDIDGATRLSDGRILLLEGARREFRLFDPNGVHVRSFGGVGEGPGEFASAPEWVVVEGDTLLTYDPSNSRYTWFTADGTLVKESQADRFAAVEELRAMGTRERMLFSDGSILRADLGLASTQDLRSLSSAPALAGVRGERSRTEISLSVVDRSDGSAVGLGTFPNTEAIRLRASGPAPTAWISNPYFPRVHYGIDPSGGQVHVAMPGVTEIHSFDRSGRLQRIVRQDVPLYPLTDDMMDTSLEALLDQPGAGDLTPMALTAAFGLLSLPDSIFPYSGLEVDTEGNLWLLDRFRLKADGPTPYHIFDPDGHWLGPIALPKGSGTVLERGADYILTEWLDEFDVPYLRMYTLEKGEG